MCLFVTLAQRKNIGYNSHKDIQKRNKGVSCHMCYDDNARPPMPPSEGAHRSTFTVGFCMGGTLSFLSGTQDFGFAGVIGFYAGVTRDFGGRGTLLEQAHKIRYPVLGLFGGADPNIPISAVQRFDEVLDEAGVEHEIVIYPGAPHSFFDRRAVEFADVSADAWQHVLSFIAAHT